MIWSFTIFLFELNFKKIRGWSYGDFQPGLKIPPRINKFKNLYHLELSSPDGNLNWIHKRILLFFSLSWLRLSIIIFDCKSFTRLTRADSIDNMTIYNSFIWVENFYSLYSNRGEISVRFAVGKFLRFSFITQDEIIV